MGRIRNVCRILFFSWNFKHFDFSLFIALIFNFANADFVSYDGSIIVDETFVRDSNGGYRRTGVVPYNKTGKYGEKLSGRLRMSKSELENGLTSIFKLKKEAFGMYRSAEEHTKIKVKKSFWLYGLPLAMLFVLFFLWKSYHFVDSMSSQTENKINANQQTDQEIHQPKSGNLKQETPNLLTTGNLKPEEFKPSIDGKPWTRPIYNEINRRFVAMEFPSGCVINQKSDQCHCYTEQGTLLRELDDGLCRDYAINGIFNPYKNPMKEGNHGT